MAQRYAELDQAEIHHRGAEMELQAAPRMKSVREKLRAQVADLEEQVRVKSEELHAAKAAAEAFRVETEQGMKVLKQWLPNTRPQGSTDIEGLWNGDHIRILVPEVQKRFDMGSCNAAYSHESWATKLVFRKGGDESSQDEVQVGDEVGIFSAETGQRLDAGNAICDEGHDNWATMFEVRFGSLSALKYNALMSLHSVENGRRLDIGGACVDGGHHSWATNFVLQTVPLTRLLTTIPT